VLCVGLSGCFPPADNSSDETKEPHFIAGKNLVEQMDWKGAVDEFEKSLEVNPRSASAHFELGWVCEEKINPPDPAAAIFHYERYLDLSGSQDKADLVKQRINNCKVELVKTVSAVGPSPSGVQRELERVAGENRDLQNQVAQLQAQIAQLKAAAVLVARTSNPPDASGTPPPSHATVSRTSSGEPQRRETSHAATGTTGSTVSAHVSHSGMTKMHTIKPRETMASIARIYGISLAALEEANPQVRPSHLLAGQTLKVPAP
jgi:LysM repeat protein